MVAPIQPLPLHHDAGGRALKGFQVVRGNPHILQAQGLEGFEAEHVADDRGGEVGDRAFLEQVEVVGDIGEILAGGAWHGVHPVGLGAVIFAVGQPVGPDHGPGGRGAFAGDGGGGFLRVHPVLRGDAEHREDVGVLGFVIRLPVAHLAVFQHAGAVTLLHVGDLEVRCLVHPAVSPVAIEGRLSAGRIQ
jgi:hypothetical protein